MSQARVTDFFAQKKHGASARSKDQKTHLDNNGVLLAHTSSTTTAAAKPKTRTTRSKNKGSVSITKPSRSARPDRAVEEEFLRVINEATSTDDLGCSDLQTATPPQSPRTPKRTSADAEFDLGSALFAAPAGHSTVKTDHSTAKKRRRLVEEETTKDADGLEKNTEAKPVKRSARKKLVLPKDTDEPQKTGQPVKSDVVQLISNPPPSVDKVPQNTVDDGAKDPLTTKITSKKTVKERTALSKDDVTALISQCQKIRKIKPEKRSPSTTESAAAPGLKTTLSRAKELAARAQQRKEERAAETARATVEPAQTEADAGEKQPAYQRYHNLAQDVPPGLSLPYGYKLLAETFRSMDTIVGMLYNRSETVTFAKVKQGVQDMTHKRFEESHMGQIKTVYPSAYTYRQEKNIPTFSATIKKSSYQLTVEPVLEASEGSEKEARPLLSASRLLDRRHYFHRSLVDIVKDHHKVFLSSLNMSVPDDKLTRWHPRFNVDEVPAVQPSPLPQPPQMEKLTTAQEVLDKARSLITPKMEKALANMALKTAETEAVLPQPNSTTPAPTPAPTPTETPSALKGVPQSLLERIRAKEAQKLLATMTRNPAQEERLLMMSRLEELARILRNVFVAEKKPALIMELACSRMVASYRSALGPGEMEKHLRLLAELAPEWLAIHQIRKDSYLKLNKNMDLSVVQEKLSHQLKEQERL